MDLECICVPGCVDVQILTWIVCPLLRCSPPGTSLVQTRQLVLCAACWLAVSPVVSYWVVIKATSNTNKQDERSRISHNFHEFHKIAVVIGRHVWVLGIAEQPLEHARCANCEYWLMHCIPDIQSQIHLDNFDGNGIMFSANGSAHTRKDPRNNSIIPWMHTAMHPRYNK